MEFFNTFFHFFTDKTRGLSYKAIISIIVVAFVILIDNTLSFSYYYNTENKIEQVENINKVLLDSTLNKVEKSQLLKLRQQIINRKTWKDKSWDLVSNLDFSKEKTSNEKTTVDEVKIKNIERSNLWHFISSSWLILILIIVFPFVGLFDKKTPLGQTIGIILILEPILYGIALVFAKVLSLIPVILNNPIYNYILNSILCFGVFALFSLFKNKKKHYTR